MLLPLITEIQRFSLQDGPGIRSTIFVKGCPLSCPWCHNPENIKPKREFYFHANKCMACGRCMNNCQSDISEHNRTVATNTNDERKCTFCLQCVSACRFGAREAVGKLLDIDSIVDEAVSDRLFYSNSGGGVTISGGEPLMYHEFTLKLARILKIRERIHVAIETSLFAKWDRIEPLLDFVDLFIVDIKSMDTAKHKQVIGGSLQVILSNFERLIGTKASVRVHLPIIPGFNNTPADFEAYGKYLGRFAASLAGVDVLPYHSYATGKYAQLGHRYHFQGVPDLPSRDLIPLINILKQIGIREVTVGGMGATHNPASNVTIADTSRPGREILPQLVNTSRQRGVIETRR